MKKIALGALFFASCLYAMDEKKSIQKIKIDDTTGKKTLSWSDNGPRPAFSQPTAQRTALLSSSASKVMPPKSVLRPRSPREKTKAEMIELQQRFQQSLVVLDPISSSQETPEEYFTKLCAGSIERRKNFDVCKRDFKDLLHSPYQWSEGAFKCIIDDVKNYGSAKLSDITDIPVYSSGCNSYLSALLYLYEMQLQPFKDEQEKSTLSNREKMDRYTKNDAVDMLKTTILKLFIVHGIDINQYEYGTTYGGTIWHAAANKNDSITMKMLLEMKVVYDSSLKDKYNRTVEEMAKLSESSKIIDLLYSKGLICNHNVLKN